MVHRGNRLLQLVKGMAHTIIHRSILYYFFINNYQITEDEYIGVTYCLEDDSDV